MPMSLKPSWYAKTVPTGFELGRDVFVSIPTGSRKRLCYVALPFIFNNIGAHAVKGAEHFIVVCVSPLSALMLDHSQV